MQRLGRNHGNYQGETIDVHQVLREIEEFSVASGWEPVPLRVSPKTVLPAYSRVVREPRRTIYISSGMHGDEPAGPLAVRRLFEKNAWPDHVNLWIIPCLNPGGFVLNRRENEDGIDLNRDYREPKTLLVQAHTEWLHQRPGFDLSLCLHEDWESNGFYLYELNPDGNPSWAEQIVRRVEKVCPIDSSPVIEGRNARNGIIQAHVDLPARRDWPEAFYLIHRKTRLSYTLEGPSDFRLATRVAGLVAGVEAVLEEAAV